MITSKNPRHIYGAITAGLHLGTQRGAVEALHESIHRTLSRLALEAPLTFGFRWQGVPFSAAVARVNERHVLSVSGNVRMLPYTVEDSDLRRRLLELVARESDRLASRFAITRDQRIACHGTFVLPDPLSRASVIGWIATYLLAFRPQLEKMLAA